MKRLFVALTFVAAFALSASAATIFTGTFDVNLGAAHFTVNSLDTSTLHTGAIGSTTMYDMVGGFHGDVTVNSGGFYGTQGAYYHLQAYPIGADLMVRASQDFHITSGNWPVTTVAFYTAHAAGPDQNTMINGAYSASMYVGSEATNPYWLACLQGAVIEKEGYITTGGIQTAYAYIGVAATLASFSNSNIWGMGFSADGTVTTHYDGLGNVRTYSATGPGQVTVDGFGSTLGTVALTLTTSGGPWSAGVDALGRPTIFFSNGATGTYTIQTK